MTNEHSTEVNSFIKHLGSKGKEDIYSLASEEFYNGFKKMPYDVKNGLSCHLLHNIYKCMVKKVIDYVLDSHDLKKYEELLLCVSSKYENETRHETALRYLKDYDSAYNQPDITHEDR